MNSENSILKMYYGAKPQTFQKAKELRLLSTEAEKLLWDKLRSNRILGYQFRQQHPINKFIAGFYCHKLKLVIEVDGGIHTLERNKEYDEGRTIFFNQWGIKVIRFTNTEIEKSLEKVIEKKEIKIIAVNTP